MDDETYIKGIAILAIAILDLMAMVKGVDGVALATSLAIIGGIAGYELKAIRDREASWK